MDNAAYKTLEKKRKCMEQDRSQKITGTQRAAAGEKRQKVFCDITWEHPAEI